MTIPVLLRRGIVAVLLVLSLLVQGTTSVLAGTTGTISGTVTDTTTNQPIPGARVTATSPSQRLSTVTDKTGHYTFVSLAPDTYNIVVSSTGDRQEASVTGVTVQADQVQNVAITQRTLATIGRVTTTASNLVKAGTTSDLYSINATQQDKASQFGGGAVLNSAWSAISSVPGVYVPSGMNGYIGAGPGISIRGGDYDQIGYELDGIPVNRSFDNYPSSVLSSLGQQELQVYTGATPANSEANGISGFINQVIKTGTAPAYRDLTGAVGTPTFYNKVAFETGGANPSRNFSYYVGAGAYNQDFRYYDNYNGASLTNTFGTPLAPCGGGSAAFTPANYPQCFGANGNAYANGVILGSPTIFAQAAQQERDNVLNLHFGLPQKGGTRDDIQILFDNSNLRNEGYSSTNDQGGAAYLNYIGLGTPAYTDPGSQVTLPYGTVLPVGYAGGTGTKPYQFPLSPTGRADGSAIPFDARDEYTNDQSIFKVQYQKNFGTTAFLRVYGYTYYSDWLNNGPQSTYSDYLSFDSPDYELSSHTRGLSATFSDQLNSKNLLTLEGGYTTANSVRHNNSFYTLNPTSAVAYLVNGNDPYNGTCYSNNGTAYVGCIYGGPLFNAKKHPNGISYLALGQLAPGGSSAAPNSTVTAANCGGGPCQYVVVNGGPVGSFNTVVPKFSSGSITDDFRPTSKLDLNFGFRYDQFQFVGANTLNSPARTLFYNAHNAAVSDPTNTALFGGALLTNVSGQINTYDEYQPRFGATYSVDPRTVLRISAGEYAEAPNTAFEQYNYLQPNSLGNLINFAANGLESTPSHRVRPEVSANYDASFEHQFGGDTSVKISPFYRKTRDQIQNFFLDQKTNFISGLNVGKQTSSGVELELDKGDFGRNGLAAKLSFTYTNSYIQYQKVPNGTTIVDPINKAIAGYNAYTSYCAANPNDPKCGKDPKTGAPGTATGQPAAPCYTAAGAADNTCAAGSIANPYYNAPVQGLLDPNGKYPTFDSFPGGIGSALGTYGAPYVSTLILQYKRNKLAITPALQFNAGQRYGIPENTPGVAPDTCGSNALAPAPAAGDPRYTYGSSGGLGYDYTTCGAGVIIPDQFTKKFDAIGQFLEPNFLQLHMQISYEVSKHLTVVSTFSNLYHKCWGGTAPGGTDPNACGYGLGFAGIIAPVGNNLNPGDPVQTELAKPYIGQPFASFPFNAYVEARLKI